ncbi:unnamed protein product [Symbiodinium sp. CCMP2456]|nr:unnamed protein product [Symbiodinium sp. CCMP2456]
MVVKIMVIVHHSHDHDHHHEFALADVPPSRDPCPVALTSGSACAEEKQDAEEERTLGPNPTLSEAGTGAEWSFQRSRLPHGAFTTPPQRFDFEIDPDSLVPGRKRCILQAGCSLSVPLPVGLASLGGLRPALEEYSLTIFFQMPPDFSPNPGQVTAILDFPRAEEAMWGEPSAQLVLLHNGKLALRSSSDEEFKQRKEKEKEEKEKNAQAQKDRLAKKKAAAKAAKKSKSRPTTPAEPEEKKEKKEDAADKDAAKTAEGEPDFRTLPSVGTWFTGLHPEEEGKKEEEKAKEGEKQEDEKANEDEEIYKSWWPPPDCETAAEVVKPGQHAAQHSESLAVLCYDIEVDA